MSNLPKYTEEERLALLEKAREGRLLKKQQREANKHLLKINYLDKGHWGDLASKYSVRMPSGEEAVDTATIKRYIKRTELPAELWDEHYTSVKFFVENNPRWTKYAAAGLVLELLDSM